MPGQNNDQPKPEVRNGLQELDYSKFGAYGPQIHEFRQRLWELITARWEEVRTHYGNLSLDKAMAGIDPSVFWFSRWQLLDELLDHQLHAFAPGESMELWEDFRTAFSPALRPYTEVADQQLMKRCHWLSQTMADVRITALDTRSHTSGKLLRQELNGVSYSAFTQEEISYLANEHSYLLDKKRLQIVEMGCGSGYLLFVINDHGGDALGIDKDQDKRLQNSEFEWTRQLLVEGQEKLFIGISKLLRDKQFADRNTLMISWPQFGSRYPARALEAFDGQFFVLKFGVFIDCLTMNDLKEIEHSGRNIREFLTILARDWKEVSLDADPDRPRYNWRSLGDNFWIFERKNKSIILNVK